MKLREPPCSTRVQVWNADQLRIKGQTPKDALAELEAYLSLLETERAAKNNYVLAQETRALRGANVWRTMLDVYAWAQTAGRNDADKLRAVADFARFMKHGSRRKRTPVVTTPVVTAPVQPASTPPTTS